jgi:hypothetical protein
VSARRQPESCQVLWLSGLPAAGHEALELTMLPIQTGITASMRDYKGKTEKRPAGVAELAITRYFEFLPSAGRPPLARAAFELISPTTLGSYVKGHTCAADALAAYAARLSRGGQTRVPRATEEAIAAVCVSRWGAGATVTRDQLVAMYTLEARNLGVVWKARFPGGPFRA